MIKSIPVSQLKVGMHVDRVDGSWLNHTLWRTTFHVMDARQLATVQESGAVRCWIDTENGIDVDGPPALEPGPLPPGVGVSPPHAVQQPSVVASPAVSMDDEVARATQLCKEALCLVEVLFDDARLGRPPDIGSCKDIVGQVVASVARHSAALTSVVRIKAKDEYLHMHSVAVCALMVGLARELGMDAESCRRAGLAGLLHDIGKAVVPQHLLDKPGPLTEAEFAVVRTHTVLGHTLLRDSGVDEPDALDVALHHHEKVSGHGYPGGLAVGSLSMMARMSAVCDVYDAVTSHRPYKDAWDPATALARMASFDGHFDRAVLAGFIKAVGVYPVGSLVRLASGKLAVVAENRPPNLRAPVVRVFYSTKAAEPVPVHLVDLQRPDARDRIVALEPREHWPASQIDRLWQVQALS